MKIATWNINSIRLRIDLLQRFAEQCEPDIIALQEIKCPDDKFPLARIKKMGFEHCVFAGQKSYNGVAILSKYPIQNSFSISLYNNDKRHIAATILYRESTNIELHNFYVPAGGDIADIEVNPKYLHKLEYVRLMQEWFAQNRNSGDNIVLVGDLNIAPHEHDVWSSRQLRNVISHTEPERTLLNALQASFDFIDTGRHFTPFSEKLYTWWSYRNRDWQKSNRGRRLDHIWTSKSLASRLKQIDIPKELRGWDTPSDHVPMILELAQKK